MKNISFKPVVTSRKNILLSALLVGYAALVINPVAAKPGDLYRNKDGGCNKGDKQRQGWCVESKAVGTAAAAGGAAPVKVYEMLIFDRWGNLITKESCGTAGGVWADTDGKGSCTEPRK